MPFFRKKDAVREVNTAKPKVVNRKRTERLCIGLTVEEKQLISNGASEAGMSRTDYILNAVKSNRVVVIMDLPKVLVELNREANNLNQLARHANAMNRVSQASVEKTCQACRNAYESLVRFVDQYDVKLKRMEEK